MRDSWRSFLEEHARLRDGVEKLREVADMVGTADLAMLSAEIEGLYRFLSHRLLPHVAVEERTLLPVIARLEGHGEAAQIMSRDHAAIAELTRELAVLRGKLETSAFGVAEATELRRTLYGLYELLTVHMAKEENICLPMLDRALTQDQRRALAEGLELFELEEQAAE